MNLLLQTLVALVTFGLSGWLIYWAGRHDERKAQDKRLHEQQQAWAKYQDARRTYFRNRFAQAKAKFADYNSDEDGGEVCAWPIAQTGDGS